MCNVYKRVLLLLSGTLDNREFVWFSIFSTIFSIMFLIVKYFDILDDNLTILFGLLILPIVFPTGIACQIRILRFLRRRSQREDGPTRNGGRDG